MPEIQEVFSMVTQKVHQDPGARDRLSRKRRRNDRNRRIGAFVVVIAIVAVGAAAFLSQGGTTTQPADPNPPAFPIAGTAYSSIVDLDTGQVTPLPESIASTHAAYYAVSPDSLQVAYSVCCTPPAPLYVANIDGTDVRQVTPDGVDAYGAQWSPDGTHIVYQQRNGLTQELGNLMSLDVSTGRTTRLTDLDQSQSWGLWFMFPSWISSNQVVYQLPRGNPNNPTWDLWLTSTTRPGETLLRRDAGWGGVAWPTSQYNVAYLSPVSAEDFTGGQMWVMNPVQHSQRHLVAGVGPATWPRWTSSGDLIAYASGNDVYVVDPETGAITKIGTGGNPEWLNGHTLVLGDLRG